MAGGGRSVKCGDPCVRNIRGHECKPKRVRSDVEGSGLAGALPAPRLGNMQMNV